MPLGSTPKAADFVLANFGPGTMDETGLGFEQLRQVKRDIMRCTGFGQYVHCKDAPFDPLGQA